MQGVQAGAHLHLLDLVHGLAVAVQHTAQLQRRTAVGVVILNAQVLGLLGVDEGSGEGVLLGDDGVVVLKAVVGQHLLDLGIRARGDLVDHAPGEGDLALILQVLQEVLGHQAGLHPRLGIGHGGAAHLIAVVGAVVHALHRDGQGPRLIALVQQGGDLAHDELGLRPALQVGGGDGIPLLGDGEAHHLERGLAENLHQAVPISAELGVGL